MSHDVRWTGSLGPRQVKAFGKALNQVSSEASTHAEVSGTADDPFRVAIYAPFGGEQPDIPGYDDRRRAILASLEALGERHGWTVDAGSYKAIMRELEAMLAEAQASRPVVDTRRAGAAERGRTWRDETALRRELERAGVEFYDGMPSVGVKVRFDPTGPATERALKGVPGDERQQVLDAAWERAQADWWGTWRDENSDWAVSLHLIFGKRARGEAAGRSAGHFVVQGANAWDFTDDTDDGAMIDRAKVDSWLALAGEIEESVKRPTVDKLLAINVGMLLE